MTQLFPDVMVDLETTGTQPEKTAIIQIAAVKFNLAEGTVSPHTFDRCLMVPPTRFWQEDTRSWWLKDKRELLTSLMGRGEKPHKVLEDFKAWIQADLDPYNDRPILWAKPSHFEYPFLEYYFKEFEVGNPFHYRETNDMNSFLRGRYFPHQAPPLEQIIPFEGDAHNAIHDVLHQIKVLMVAKSHSTPHPAFDPIG